MTTIKRWNPGDPITAERLNVDQAEALRPRRDVNLGNGSSLVNETLGNQSANMQPPLLRLAIATERFRIPDERTDLPVPDDVPSGLCKMMRLSRYDSVHREETRTNEFRAWDVLGGLNNAPMRERGEVFYVVFNKDSKRWEVLVAPPNPIIHAIVLSCLGDGWHEVEIVNWNGVPGASSSGSLSNSLSVSDENECDVCSLLPDMTVPVLGSASVSDSVDIDEESCNSTDSLEIARTEGDRTGEIVYAHTTRLMPMLSGGMIKMMKRSIAESSDDSLSASISSSQSLSVSDEISTDHLYDVVEGVWPLVSLPFPTYECCVDPDTGASEIRMTACNKVIVEGYACDGPESPCPQGTASGSESV